MTPAVDPECALAAAYAPAAARAALTALWRLDATLARIALTTREPTLAAIKLAWWRDALAALADGPAPAEPLLRDAAALLLPAGVSGPALAAIEAGWSAVLPGSEDDDGLARHAAERGGRLFAMAATILGGGGVIAGAGEGWALVDLARRLGPGAPAERALAEARPLFQAHPPRRWPKPLRPLGMLAALARADAGRTAATLPRQGSPRRIARMLGHRLTGY